MPGAQARLLSEQDVAVLQGWINDSKSRRHNTSGRSTLDRVEDQEHQAPECYACLTPKTGIPALSKGSKIYTGTGTGTSYFPDDDVPGVASCKVYFKRIDTNGMVYAGFSIDVYNLRFIAVAPEVWITPIRDKSGVWWVPEPGLEFAVCP